MSRQTKNPPPPPPHTIFHGHVAEKTPWRTAAKDPGLTGLAGSSVLTGATGAATWRRGAPRGAPRGCAGRAGACSFGGGALAGWWVFWGFCFRFKGSPKETCGCCCWFFLVAPSILGQEIIIGMGYIGISCERSGPGGQLVPAGPTGLLFKKKKAGKLQKRGDVCFWELSRFSRGGLGSYLSRGLGLGESTESTDSAPVPSPSAGAPCPVKRN